MKELLYLFIENKLNLLFVYLPESLKTGLAIILYSVFVLLLLYYIICKNMHNFFSDYQNKIEEKCF